MLNYFSNAQSYIYIFYCLQTGCRRFHVRNDITALDGSSCRQSRYRNQPWRCQQVLCLLGEDPNVVWTFWMHDDDEVRKRRCLHSRDSRWSGQHSTQTLEFPEFLKLSFIKDLRVFSFFNLRNLFALISVHEPSIPSIQSRLRRPVWVG